MTAVAIDLPRSYLTEKQTVISWVFTTDHKRVALLFFVSITFFFFIGGAAATLIRLHLVNPESNLLQPDIYNRMFTMHGIVMVWFFLIPSIPTTMGNFFVPLMIGAHDLAFPRLNIASWHVFNLSGVVLLYLLLMGGVDIGWTFYTPFSTAYANSYVTATAVAVFINGFSTIMTALNFAVTIHRLRAPGMYWSRLPLFIWAVYATSVVMLLAAPVLAISLFLIALDRLAVGDQGVQLDRHPAQGLDRVRRADALCARLYRPLYDGRSDRPRRRDAGARCAPDRHLFRHRPFPLHHGWRRGQRLFRRAALLVAQDYRPALPRDLGARRRDPDVSRL